MFSTQTKVSTIVEHAVLDEVCHGCGGLGDVEVFDANGYLQGSTCHRCGGCGVIQVERIIEYASSGNVSGELERGAEG